MSTIKNDKYVGKIKYLFFSLKYIQLIRAKNYDSVFFSYFGL